MRADTGIAKNILIEEKLTCVFCRNGELIKCSDSGVKPLLELIDNRKTLDGFCAADKVAGSAAAYLYTVLQPREVYARVMSENAVKILKNANITPYYDACVEVIFNRQNTGICPMENAVKECGNAEQALAAIKETVSKLQSANVNKAPIG